jgi:hypothetical protein
MLDALTDRTRVTSAVPLRVKQHDAGVGHERRSAAEPFPLWSNVSSVINILPLKAKVKHRVPCSPIRDCPFELEITFCVRGVNVPLMRNARGGIRWPATGPYLIEWRENGRRLRAAAGVTPSEALEAQKRKRLELDAHSSGLTVLDPEEEARGDALPLAVAISKFLQDIRTFRKPLTSQNTSAFSNSFPNMSRQNLMPGISLPRT